MTNTTVEPGRRFAEGVLARRSRVCLGGVKGGAVVTENSAREEVLFILCRRGIFFPRLGLACLGLPDQSRFDPLQCARCIARRTCGTVGFCARGVLAYGRARVREKATLLDFVGVYFLVPASVSSIGVVSFGRAGILVWFWGTDSRESIVVVVGNISLLCRS